MARLLFLFTVFALGLAGCQLVESILLPDPKPMPSPRPQPSPKPSPMGREFHVLRDGFSFANYSGYVGPYELSPANLERLCGREACARGHGDSCVPSASIRSFWNYANKSAEGGRCEGISVTSREVFDGYLSLRELDPSARTTYEARFTQNVQSRIGYNQTTQLTSPTKYHRPLTPSQIVWELQNSKKTYSAGFCKRDLSGCHAVNPIRVVQDSKNSHVFWIHVYDSNYPGVANKYIRVNTLSNQWTYDDYEGDEATQTLFIRDYQNRLKKATCPTDGNLDVSDEDEAEEEDDGGEWWQFWLNGDGSVLVPKETKWIPRTSDDIEDGQLPIFVFRPGKEVKIKIVGKNLSGKPTDLAFFNKGQSMTIEGIQLDSMETDRFAISADGRGISYSSTDKENIIFTLGATYKGADYQVRITPVTKNEGFLARFTNHVDNKKGNHELAFEVKSANGRLATFAVELIRIDDNSDEKFTHQKQVLSIGGNETIVLKYGKWLKNGQNLEFTRDVNSDGKVDRVQSVSDDE